METRRRVRGSIWFSYRIPGCASCVLGGRQADLPAAEDVVLLHMIVFSQDDKFTFGQNVFEVCFCFALDVNHRNC